MVLPMSLFLLSCSAPEFEVDEELRPAAMPLLEFAQSDQEAPLNLETDQPEPYASFVRANISQASFRFESNARQFDFSRTATVQDYLPQIKPGIRLDFEGQAVLALNISQVLFDGNVRDARIRQGDAEAVLDHLQVLSNTNDAISEDIATYLNYWKNRETETALKEIANWIEGILKTAERRAVGGIGKASEVSLFTLKLTEVRTDADIAASQAAVDLLSLNEVASKKPPVAIPYSLDKTPLAVSASVARRELAKYQFELVQRQQRPQVSLRADTTLDIESGDTNTDSGLAVDRPALTFGGSAKVQIAQEALSLANGDLADMKTETQTDILRMEAQIRALRSQQKSSKELTRQARERLDSFPSQFRAGSANLTEANSLADSLRRAAETEIEVKYRIFNLQRELAQLTGSYWR